MQLHSYGPWSLQLVPSTHYSNQQLQQEPLFAMSDGIQMRSRANSRDSFSESFNSSPPESRDSSRANSRKSSLKLLDHGDHAAHGADGALRGTTVNLLQSKQRSEKTLEKTAIDPGPNEQDGMKGTSVHMLQRTLSGKKISGGLSSWKEKASWRASKMNELLKPEDSTVKKGLVGWRRQSVASSSKSLQSHPLFGALQSDSDPTSDSDSNVRRTLSEPVKDSGETAGSPEGSTTSELTEDSGSVSSESTGLYDEHAIGIYEPAFGPNIDQWNTLDAVPEKLSKCPPAVGPFSVTPCIGEQQVKMTIEFKTKQWNDGNDMHFFTVTEPKSLLDQVYRATGDADVFGFVSPVAPVTLPARVRKQANIPLESSWFSFVHPIHSISSLSAEQLAEHGLFPEKHSMAALLVWGGYCYMDDKGTVDQVNALGLENPSLHLKGPFALPQWCQEHLDFDGRMQPVTLPYLLQSGATKVAWIKPGEDIRWRSSLWRRRERELLGNLEEGSPMHTNERKLCDHSTGLPSGIMEHGAFAYYCPKSETKAVFFSIVVNGKTGVPRKVKALQEQWDKHHDGHTHQVHLNSRHGGPLQRPDLNAMVANRTRSRRGAVQFLTKGDREKSFLYGNTSPSSQRASPTSQGGFLGSIDDAQAGGDHGGKSALSVIRADALPVHVNEDRYLHTRTQEPGLFVAPHREEHSPRPAVGTYDIADIFAKVNKRLGVKFGREKRRLFEGRSDTQSSYMRSHEPHGFANLERLGHSRTPEVNLQRSIGRDQLPANSPWTLFKKDVKDSKLLSRSKPRPATASGLSGASGDGHGDDQLESRRKLFGDDNLTGNASLSRSPLGHDSPNRSAVTSPKSLRPPKLQWKPTTKPVANILDDDDGEKKFRGVKVIHDYPVAPGERSKSADFTRGSFRFSADLKRAGAKTSTKDADDGGGVVGASNALAGTVVTSPSAKPLGRRTQPVPESSEWSLYFRAGKGGPGPATYDITSVTAMGGNGTNGPGHDSASKPLKSKSAREGFAGRVGRDELPKHMRANDAIENGVPGPCSYGGDNADNLGDRVLWGAWGVYNLQRTEREGSVLKTSPEYGRTQRQLAAQNITYGSRGKRVVLGFDVEVSSGKELSESNEFFDYSDQSVPSSKMWSHLRGEVNALKRELDLHIQTDNVTSRLLRDDVLHMHSMAIDVLYTASLTITAQCIKSTHEIAYMRWYPRNAGPVLGKHRGVDVEEDEEENCSHERLACLEACHISESGYTPCMSSIDEGASEFELRVRLGKSQGRCAVFSGPLQVSNKKAIKGYEYVSSSPRRIVTLQMHPMSALKLLGVCIEFPNLGSKDDVTYRKTNRIVSRELQRARQHEADAARRGANK